MYLWAVSVITSCSANIYQNDLVRAQSRGRVEVTHINKIIYFYLPMLRWLWLLHCWLHLLAECRGLAPSASAFDIRQCPETKGCAECRCWYFYKKIKSILYSIPPCQPPLTSHHLTFTAPNSPATGSFRRIRSGLLAANAMHLKINRSLELSQFSMKRWRLYYKSQIFLDKRPEVTTVARFHPHRLLREKIPRSLLLRISYINHDEWCCRVL